jgi:hypothetical protein
MRGFVLAAAMILVSAGAQADESRNLSLGGSDEAVQETQTAEPVSAIETVWAPMPRGEEAKTTKSFHRWNTMSGRGADLLCEVLKRRPWVGSEHDKFRSGVFQLTALCREAGCIIIPIR